MPRGGALFEEESLKLFRRLSGRSVSGDVSLKASSFLPIAKRQDPEAASRRKIAALIPAYNEAKNIGAVLKALKKIDLLDEILVVDDGSEDGTADVAKDAGFDVLKLTKNQGKGAALQAGLKAVDADVYLLLDADLLGLEYQHINKMVRPLLEDSSLAMTVGKFIGGRKRTDWAQYLVPQISGQRAITKALAQELPDLTKTGFGTEIVITRHCKKNGFLSKEVLLENLTQVMKEEKLGLIKGFIYRLKMYNEILKNILKR